MKKWFELYWLHLRADVLQYLRMPAFYLPMIVYPMVLYIAVGLPQGEGVEERTLVTLGFILFSILGTVVFQFGVGVAVTRDSAWERLVLSWPLPPVVRISSRLTSAIFFAFLFSLPVLFIGLVFGAFRVSLDNWPGLILAIVLGAACMGAMGLAMGYWFPIKGALGLANLVYLPLSFAGGLFSGGSVGDSRIDAIGEWLPTGVWSGLVTSAVEGGGGAAGGVSLLIAYGIIFTLLAGWGYSRCQALVYR